MYHQINVQYDVSNTLYFLSYCVVPSLSTSNIPSDVPSDVPSNGKFCSDLFCSTNEWMNEWMNVWMVEWYLARRVYDSIRVSCVNNYLWSGQCSIQYVDSETLFFWTSFVVPSLSLSPSDLHSDVPSDVPSNGKFCSVQFSLV